MTKPDDGASEVAAALASHFDRAEFSRLLSDAVAPVLAEAGYRRSGSTWRKPTAVGDVAIVQVHATSRHVGHGFIAGVGVSPEPWLRWVTGDGPRRRPSNPEGDCVWEARLVPTGAAVELGGIWFPQGNADLAACFADIGRQLVDWVVPRLDELLDRECLLNAVAAEFGQTQRGVWHLGELGLRALLLAEDGPSPELDALVERLPQKTDGMRALVAWVRDRSGRSIAR
jgi:hypothetical protein